MNRQAVTVSQLNRYVKAKLSLDPKLSGLTVKGELSNFKCHSKSSHFYFTLKDEACSIRAVMFYAGRRDERHCDGIRAGL